MTFLSIYIITICNLLHIFVNCQIIYNGPASNEYFLSTSTKSIINLPKLGCGKNYLDKTNAKNPVVYYKLDITPNMLKTWKSKLMVTTCCGPSKLFNEITNNVVECPTNDSAVDENGKPEQCLKSKLLHEKYCKKQSLDTLIYVLYKKKGQLNLIETADDYEMGTCQNTEKSVINLAEYSEGEYIIGIGGYSNEYGKYFIQMSCEKYLYMGPIESLTEQLDPLESNATSVPYNQTVSDSFIQSNKMKYMIYFQFSITDNIYLPIVITACFSVPKQRRLYQVGPGVPVKIFILLVSEQDYYDCKLHLQKIFDEYKADPSINMHYTQMNRIVVDSDNDNDSDNNNDDEKEEEHGEIMSSIIQQSYNKCSIFVVPFMYYTLHIFAMIVSIFCYGGGAVGPFIIFFCW